MTRKELDDGLQLWLLPSMKKLEHQVETVSTFA
jgi:hypothetical protein